MRNGSRFSNTSGFDDDKVLESLRILMMVHAFLDLAGAIVLFFTPKIVQELAPTLSLSPFTLRIVAGAFTAIAYASAKASTYEKAKTFLQLLQFKCVWSTVVWIGIILSIAELKKDGDDVPGVLWVTLAVFITGSTLWNTFNILLLKMERVRLSNHNIS